MNYSLGDYYAFFEVSQFARQARCRFQPSNAKNINCVSYPHSRLRGENLMNILQGFTLCLTSNRIEELRGNMLSDQGSRIVISILTNSILRFSNNCSYLKIKEVILLALKND